jgi:hypothetical protein
LPWVTYRFKKAGPVFIFLLLPLVYLVPTVIALVRRHKNALAIVLINIFLGWSVLGWLIVLIWSLTGRAAQPPGYYYHPGPYEHSGYHVPPQPPRNPYL